MWSVLHFFGMRWAAQFWVHWMKAMDRGSRNSRNERTAVVEAWQNEWSDQLHCSVNGKMLLDRADTAKLVVTGFGSLIYEVYYAVCCQGEHQGFWRSETVSVISSSWRVFTEIEDSFCFIPMSISPVLCLSSLQFTCDLCWSQLFVKIIQLYNWFCLRSVHKDWLRSELYIFCSLVLVSVWICETESVV